MKKVIILLLTTIFCLPIMSSAQKISTTTISADGSFITLITLNGQVVIPKGGFGKIVEKTIDNESGIATIKYESGHIYVGECKNDQPNGNGELTLPNGDKYPIKFKNGKLSIMKPSGDGRMLKISKSSIKID